MGRSTGTENSSIGTRAPRHTSNGPVGEPATRNRAGDAKHFAESHGLYVSTPEKPGCVAGALASGSQRRLVLSQISRIHSVSLSGPSTGTALLRRMPPPADTWLPAARAPSLPVPAKSRGEPAAVKKIGTSIPEQSALLARGDIGAFISFDQAII